MTPEISIIVLKNLKKEMAKKMLKRKEKSLPEKDEEKKTEEPKKSTIRIRLEKLRSK